MDHLPDKETRRRRAKKTFEIDFSHDLDFETYFRTTRVRRVRFTGVGVRVEVGPGSPLPPSPQAATTNSRSALSVTNRKTSLPADFQFPPETLSQLSLKPSSSVGVGRLGWMLEPHKHQHHPLVCSSS